MRPNPHDPPNARHLTRIDSNMPIMLTLPFASIPAKPDDINECDHSEPFATFFTIDPDSLQSDESPITLCKSCAISNALYLLLNLNNDEMPD